MPADAHDAAAVLQVARRCVDPFLKASVEALGLWRGTLLNQLEEAVAGRAQTWPAWARTCSSQGVRLSCAWRALCHHALLGHGVLPRALAAPDARDAAGLSVRRERSLYFGATFIV